MEAVKDDVLKKNLNSLLERGVKFSVPTTGLLRLFRKKDIVFTIREPYLYTLDRLSDISVRIGLDEEKLQSQPIEEAKRLTKRGAKLASKYISVAILQKRIYVRFLGSFLAFWLYDKITPTKLLQLTSIILQISNMPDFTNSIRLMTLMQEKIMTPNRIEERLREEKARGVEGVASVPTSDGHGSFFMKASGGT